MMMQAHRHADGDQAERLSKQFEACSILARGEVEFLASQLLVRREKLEEEEEEMGKARERLKVELAEISEVLQDAVEAYRLAKQQSEEFEKRDQASCVGLDQSRAAFSDARDKSVAFETALASETSSLQAAHALNVDGLKQRLEAAESQLQQAEDLKQHHESQLKPLIQEREHEQHLQELKVQNILKDSVNTIRRRIAARCIQRAWRTYRATRKEQKKRKGKGKVKAKKKEDTRKRDSSKGAKTPVRAAKRT